MIEADDAIALVIATGSISVGNAGLMEATGRGGLVIRDCTVDSAAGGVILAGAGSHVALQGADLIGGTLDSVGTGLIATFKGGPNTLDGTASAVANQALVVVQNGTSLTIEGAIVNTGQIQLASSGLAATLTIGGAGATLSGGGKVVLRGNANNIIVGAGGATMLTNVDNNVGGGGNLGGGLLTLVNQAKGVIVGTQSTALIIDTGPNVIVNAGVILARGRGGTILQSAVDNSGTLESAGGVLTVNGAVSGTGQAMVYAGTVDFTSAFSQKVTFQGPRGVLGLAQSQDFAASISGFSTTGGTSLDLGDIGFVSASEATYSGTTTSGVLTVTDGVHTAHIHFTGNYLGSTWTASSDGHGGTIVVDPRVASPAAAHRFVGAMAGLGAPEGGVAHLHRAWPAQERMLAPPAP